MRDDELISIKKTFNKKSSPSVRRVCDENTKDSTQGRGGKWMLNRDNNPLGFAGRRTRYFLTSCQ
jgi:hypothetical protein